MLFHHTGIIHSRNISIYIQCCELIGIYIIYFDFLVHMGKNDFFSVCPLISFSLRPPLVAPNSNYGLDVETWNWMLC
jgi:hypothetical protein